MKELMRKLFPLERSITGNGVRETLRIIGSEIPLEGREVTLPTQAYDWKLDSEWEFHSVIVAAPGLRWEREIEVWPVYGGEGYIGVMSKAELEPHVHTLPDKPDAIPYVTNYYGEGWGVAMRHNDWLRLPSTGIRVQLICERKRGWLTYADLVIGGASKDEVLLTSYICHPKMANNELSGPVVLVELVKWLMQSPHRYTYRIVLAPETIGPQIYMMGHYAQLQQRVKAGWVLTCLGGPGNFSLQRTRSGNTLPERVSSHVLRHCGGGWSSVPWKDRASDERQWAAPHPNLPVCSLRKTFPFPEYHTSDDNLDYVTEAQLEESLRVFKLIIETLEANRTLKAVGVGEPMMSRRGLYPTVSTPGSCREPKPLLDVLSLCDGRDLLDVANVLDKPLWNITPLAQILLGEGLVMEVTG